MLRQRFASLLATRAPGRGACREFLAAARFGLIGLMATAVHLLMVWQLIARTELPALVANLLAFLTAFWVSFVGNYFWTFQVPGSPWRALCRFLLIATSGLALNTLLLACLLSGNLLSPTAAALVSTAAVPAVTFLASRFWGFRRDGGAAE
ncbi:GtrA family protein [Accumulibacter sp.]|uniref:GtrA family protein n=1 Tax=Accumulibacter sp. TaxID=2053492 RepID=UPI0025ED71F8|nr:GtrA family protein [Accumulibacter sp.]MCM8627397.1 GtrA family protein [Accumulibacter sp.]